LYNILFDISIGGDYPKSTANFLEPGGNGCELRVASCEVKNFNEEKIRLLLFPFSFSLEFPVSLVASIRHTPCAMHYALCAMRHAPCAMRFALCAYHS
jgi:hypothetical protein